MRASSFINARTAEKCSGLSPATAVFFAPTAQSCAHRCRLNQIRKAAAERRQSKKVYRAADIAYMFEGRNIHVSPAGGVTSGSWYPGTTSISERRLDAHWHRGRAPVQTEHSFVAKH